MFVLSSPFVLDLRLRPQLVRLLVESHRIVKNPGHGPAGGKKKKRKKKKVYLLRVEYLKLPVAR